MNVETAAKEFIRSFPEYAEEHAAHLEDYNEILGHVFFGCVINTPLFHLLSINQDKQAIQKYVNFIEYMYESGDKSVQNIVGVTILEFLGDDDTVLKNAFEYFSEDIMLASKSIETGLGRREIHIYHKDGHAFAEW